MCVCVRACVRACIVYCFWFSAVLYTVLFTVGYCFVVGLTCVVMFSNMVIDPVAMVMDVYLMFLVL